MRFMPSIQNAIVALACSLTLAGCIRVKDKQSTDAEPESQQSQPQTQNTTAEKDDRPKPGPIDDDAPEEYTELPSGLKYRILRKSDGASPKPRDLVTFHSIGKQITGDRFEHTYIVGTPITARVSKNQLIDGIYEGIQLCQVGGMVEFEIPSRLAFGARGNLPKIPANADLIYTIELLSIDPWEAPTAEEKTAERSDSNAPPTPPGSE